MKKICFPSAFSRIWISNGTAALLTSTVMINWFHGCASVNHYSSPVCVPMSSSNSQWHLEWRRWPDNETMLYPTAKALCLRLLHECSKAEYWGHFLWATRYNSDTFFHRERRLSAVCRLWRCGALYRPLKISAIFLHRIINSLETWAVRSKFRKNLQRVLDDRTRWMKWGMKMGVLRPISRFISKTTQDTTSYNVEDEYEVVCDLSNAFYFQWYWVTPNLLFQDYDVSITRKW